MLICPNREAAQQALRLVQEWAVDFGMTIGVGQGKSMAMMVNANTVKQACRDDVNGMPKRNATTATITSGVNSNADPVNPGSDDDNSTIFDDPDSFQILL